MTPILYAAYENCELSLQTLVNAGADLGAVDGHRRNALHLAAIRNSVNALRVE